MSFHSKMWALARRTKSAGLSRIRFVAQTAIMDHKFSYQKATLLKALKIDLSALDTSLKMQDVDRLSKPRIMKAKKKLEKVLEDYTQGAF